MSNREAMSELSLSVREGAGYNEVFSLGRELGEDFALSLDREPSTQSLSDENKEEDEGDVEGDEYDEGERDEEDGEEEKDGEDDEGTPFEGGDLGSQEDGGGCPFILPTIWTVNDFYSTMSSKVFNKLRDCYQIPENIPICLPRKFEQCYSGKTVDVGMYYTMFVMGFRLPLMELHRQLVNYLGLFVSQIADNAWRIFIRAEVLWGCLNNGNRQLTLDEFFYCYRPEHISSS